MRHVPAFEQGYGSYKPLYLPLPYSSVDGTCGNRPAGRIVSAATDTDEEEHETACPEDQGEAKIPAVNYSGYSPSKDRNEKTCSHPLKRSMV